ncbi:hypothetical protein BC832DRAFT_141070 [Gaertneriomyces semiglobifer]|nr:hypothetical protein BC832DRAFT_141070 [Gaertneriomyces semiglobifer]
MRHALTLCNLTICNTSICSLFYTLQGDAMRMDVHPSDGYPALTAPIAALFLFLMLWSMATPFSWS